MTAKPTRNAQDIQRARGQEDQILSMLRTAGPAGCTNSQLWTVAHAVNSRISDLRKRGHKITAESEGGGVWRYRLIAARRVEAVERDRLPLFASAGVAS